MVTVGVGVGAGVLVGAGVGVGGGVAVGIWVAVGTGEASVRGTVVTHAPDKAANDIVSMSSRMITLEV